MAPQSIIGPAEPLGEFTLTCAGFEADSVTTASSSIIISVEFPILLEITGFELVKTALNGYEPAARRIRVFIVATPLLLTGDAPTETLLTKNSTEPVRSGAGLTCGIVVELKVTTSLY